MATNGKHKALEREFEDLLLDVLDQDYDLAVRRRDDSLERRRRALATLSFSYRWFGRNPVRTGAPMGVIEIPLKVPELDALYKGCLTDADGNNPVVNLLTGYDMYTLFAPTDAAFEKLQGALGITEPAPSLTCAVDSIFGEGTLFTILAYHVTASGGCGFCGAPIAGRYGTFDKPFGSRRIPVRISAYPGRAA